MAKGPYTENGRQYVIVESGDTLSEITLKHLGSASPATYNKVAAINGINDPDVIHIGQKIYLTSSGSSSSSSSSSGNQFKIVACAPISDNERMMHAEWTWALESQTESYKVLWTYKTGNGIEMEGSSEEIDIDHDYPSLSRMSTFEIPTNARVIYFRVKPISKTYGDKNEKKYFPDQSWSYDDYIVAEVLEAPGSAPNVELENGVITMSLSDINITGADSIIFQITRDNSGAGVDSWQAQPVKIETGWASVTYQTAPGHLYKARCKAYNSTDGAVSPWTEYTENISSIPPTPSGFTSIRATSANSIRLSWEAVATAKSYDIEYATEKEKFEQTPGADSKEGITDLYCELAGLESGKEYFFRIRAVNDSNDNGGKSKWSEISDGRVIGTAPSAPTTWSSTTTATKGETVILYWVHNSEDGSRETYADIELYVDETLVPMEPIENTASEDDDTTIHTYELDTSEFSEGCKITWRVRTMGIDKGTDGDGEGGWGDWSDPREIDVYEAPTLEMRIIGSQDDVVTGFPFIIHAIAGPSSSNQTPTGFYVSISSNQAYDTVDSLGNPRTVSEGEIMYSKYFNAFDDSMGENATINGVPVEITPGELLVVFDPGNIDLASSMSYTATCTVSMDSGLTAEKSVSFTVSWEEVSYVPDAQVTIDHDNLTATIRPYCTDRRIVWYKVELVNGVYTRTDESLGYVYCNSSSIGQTPDGERVFQGTDATGETVKFVRVTESYPVSDMYMTVYRREYDGKFTKINEQPLDAAKNTAVTDPHPALDYARYRIVATSKSTGAVGYVDISGEKVGCPAIVIQWAEAWTNFEVEEDDILTPPSWSGSLLKLMYNVDVNENNSPNVSFIEYIGREHPVSYYGTQLGESATWNVSVPKYDKETIYALRRLAKWMGDVYVREPSGVGYWANITVSFAQTHCEPVVPVTFTIKRVEGGV